MYCIEYEWTALPMQCYAIDLWQRIYFLITNAAAKAKHPSVHGHLNAQLRPGSRLVYGFATCTWWVIFHVTSDKKTWKVFVSN